MSRIFTLARLTSADRRLLGRAGVLVAAIRVLLWARTWPSVLRRVGGWPFVSTSSPGLRGVPVARLTWAVSASSRLVPGATCLAQALALQCLLKGAGYTSRVQIGVAKDAQGGLLAHAWVEHEDRTLLSMPADIERYARLLTVESASRH